MNQKESNNNWYVLPLSGMSTTPGLNEGDIKPLYTKGK